MLIVGDSKGRVHSLKLSPNLRIRTKEAKEALEEGGVEKLMKVEKEKIIAMLLSQKKEFHGAGGSSDPSKSDKTDSVQNQEAYFSKWKIDQ